MTWYAPGTAWQYACRGQSGSREGDSVAAKTTPEVPIATETDPASTIPQPTASAA